uniref:Uncharacterized protein n=1 Tax=Opuntia streptacantha TaxID=393608 RepID=A0A7C8ZI56_OPUST
MRPGCFVDACKPFSRGPPSDGKLHSKSIISQEAVRILKAGGGAIFSMCLLKDASSSDNLLALFGVPLLEMQSSNSLDLEFLSAGIRIGFTPVFEAHLLSTYLRRAWSE